MKPLLEKKSLESWSDRQLFGLQDDNMLLKNERLAEWANFQFDVVPVDLYLLPLTQTQHWCRKDKGSWNGMSPDWLAADHCTLVCCHDKHVETS